MIYFPAPWRDVLPASGLAAKCFIIKVGAAFWLFWYKIEILFRGVFRYRVGWNPGLRVSLCLPLFCSLSTPYAPFLCFIISLLLSNAGTSGEDMSRCENFYVWNMLKKLTSKKSNNINLFGTFGKSILLEQTNWLQVMVDETQWSIHVLTISITMTIIYGTSQ